MIPDLKTQPLDLVRAIELNERGELHGLFFMSEYDYRMAPGLNQSELKIMGRCPALCRQESEKKPSRALDIGTLAHLLVLEGREAFNRVACPFPEGNPRTKVYREEKEVLLDQGKILVKGTDLAILNGIARSARRDPVVNDLMDSSLTEVVAFAKHPSTGVLMKGKLDIVKPSASVVADLKTTSNADTDDFSRSAKRYQYDYQAAYYLDLINFAIGVEWFFKFVIFAVDKHAPYLFNYFYVTPSDLASARARYTSDMERWIECESTGEWPGYDKSFKALNFR